MRQRVMIASKKLEVTVDGSLTVNGALAIRAALDGVGVCRVLSDYVAPLEDWAPRPMAFYLYYPSRRQNPAPLEALIEFLRRTCETPTAHNQPY
jgi:DNA-binding transcriptional LysR family regulator